MESISLADTVTLEDGEAALARLERKGPKTYQHAFEKYEVLIDKDKTNQGRNCMDRGVQEDRPV